MTQNTDTLRAEILKTLQRIIDPTTGQNIVASGMVDMDNLHVGEDGRVILTLKTSPKKQAEGELIRQQAADMLQKIPHIGTVSAVLTAEKQQPRPVAPGVKHIIAISSAKGGVGKSTIAVNLAYALKNQGLSVGLLDADIYGPSQPTMTGLDTKPEMTADKYILPPTKEGMPIMSIGFLISNADTALVWRGPMVQKALLQMLCDVKWGELDVLILDLPPGTGDVQLTLAQKTPLSGVIVISTPQDIALIDAVKGVNMFKKLNIPILGLIENMSQFTCTNCHHEHHIFGHNTAKAEATKHNIPYLGDIPLTIEARTCADNGTPVVEKHPDNATATAIKTIAENLKLHLFEKAA